MEEVSGKYYCITNGFTGKEFSKTYDSNLSIYLL